MSNTTETLVYSTKEHDRFECATAAMQGLLSNPTMTQLRSDQSRNTPEEMRRLATDAVELADALLAALAKPTRVPPTN